MRIEEAYNQYLLYAKTERGYAPETLIKIRDAFHSRLQPAFRGRDVGSITRFDVLRFRNQLIEEKLSVARQYNLLMVLRLFLKFSRDLLKLSCLAPAEVPLPRRQVPHVQFQLGQKEIEIVGKGGKRREVFLTDRCILWGRKLLRARSDAHPALFTTATEPPRRWQRNDVSRFFIELRERVGIEKPLTPHLLRHTYCTTLLHNGADITFIRDLAGHSDIRTTARYYLGVDRKALRKTVDQYLDYRLPDAA